MVDTPKAVLVAGGSAEDFARIKQYLPEWQCVSAQLN